MDCIWQVREKIGSIITICLIALVVLWLVRPLTQRGEFEEETDWELEAEVGAETGWVERPEEIISEKLNLKYWENCSCRHLNIEARTTEKSLG